MDTTKKKNHYIDKEAFYNELVKYHDMPENKKKINDYIGNCILMICNGLAKKPNFSGYTYIDEMISDGVENCVMAVDSFDVNNDKKNPFWYFSKIAYYAFLRRIKFEKKQSYIKHKNVQQYFLHGKIVDVASNDLSDRVISDFEEGQKREKEKKDKAAADKKLDQK